MGTLSRLLPGHNRLSARVLIWTLSIAHWIVLYQWSCHNRLSARVLIWTPGRTRTANPQNNGSQSPVGSSPDLDVITKNGKENWKMKSHNRLSARVLIWTPAEMMLVRKKNEESHNRLSARVLIWTPQPKANMRISLVCHNRLSARVLIWTGVGE